MSLGEAKNKVWFETLQLVEALHISVVKDIFPKRQNLINIEIHIVHK